MADVYAVIDMTTPGSGTGTVINTQMMMPTDPMNSSYTYVIVTALSCNDGSPIQIGCTYDGTNFYPQAGS